MPAAVHAVTTGDVQAVRLMLIYCAEEIAKVNGPCSLIIRAVVVMLATPNDQAQAREEHGQQPAHAEG